MIQFDPRVREILDDGSMLVQDFAEGGLVDIGSTDQRKVESTGSDSEGTHARKRRRESIRGIDEYSER